MTNVIHHNFKPPPPPDPWRHAQPMTEYIIYAAPDDDQGVEDARTYARKYQLTQDTTRIYKSEGQVKVAVHKIPPSLEETRLWNWLRVGLE